MRTRHPYHLPRNATNPPEILFLLKIIDPRKRSYLFHELEKMLLVREVEDGLFEQIHSGFAQRIARNHPGLYGRFMSDPSTHYETLMEAEHSRNKIVKQVWVELARDPIDFVAYCGLLPCFFKNPFQRSEKEGYLVTDRLKGFKRGQVGLADVLLDFKYANGSINLQRYPDFNIEVRPFYCALAVLKGLDDLQPIPARILTQATFCMREENEIPEMIREIRRCHRSGEWRIPRYVGHEASRSSAVIFPILEKAGLVERQRKFSLGLMVSLTDEGRSLLERQPGRCAFYRHRVDGVPLTPLIGYLLYSFTDAVASGRGAVRRLTLQRARAYTMTEIDEGLQVLAEMDPSPISSMTATTVRLEPLQLQYNVAPGVDFSSLWEAAMARGERAPVVPLPLAIVEPPRTVIEPLTAAALSSEGAVFEEAINNALVLLPGETKWLGTRRSFERYSDLGWLVSVEDEHNPDQAHLLVLIEAKSGNSIRQLDERQVEDELKNTLRDHYSDILTDLVGLWVWILDGVSIPSSGRGHGGFRGSVSSQRSFLEKLMQIQLHAITQPCLVTALDVESFLEYYDYLYRSSRGLQGDCFTPIQCYHFWHWSNVFRPAAQYVSVYDDARHFRSLLV